MVVNSFLSISKFTYTNSMSTGRRLRELAGNDDISTAHLGSERKHYTWPFFSRNSYRAFVRPLQVLTSALNPHLSRLSVRKASFGSRNSELSFDKEERTEDVEVSSSHPHNISRWSNYSRTWPWDPASSASRMNKTSEHADISTHVRRRVSRLDEAYTAPRPLPTKYDSKNIQLNDQG